MVEELLHSDLETAQLFATERYLSEHRLQDDRLETVSEVQMEQMSGQDTPPGVLAVVMKAALLSTSHPIPCS